MGQNILIVEDDGDISNLLCKIVTGTGFSATQAFSGTEAKLLLKNGNFDLLLLDLMLPGLSGEELISYIREELKNPLPVLVISAKKGLQDKVSLLTLGADDYITKPFEPDEVAARIIAAMRRTWNLPVSPSSFSHKNMTLFPEARRVTVSGKELSLTAHEFDLLLLLIKNPDKVYARESLYELVWNGGYYGENNTVNVHVSNLRKKIKEVDPETEYISTVYGIGFKLC